MLLMLCFKPIHQFRVRTRGQDDDTTNLPLNELSDSGATPTGLSEFDLNSPEDDPASYGPYPVNRFVHGLQGNQAIWSVDSNGNNQSEFLVFSSFRCFVVLKGFY